MGLAAPEILLIAGIASTAAATGAQLAQGEQARHSQTKSLRLQQQAQASAKQAAVSQQVQAQQAQAAANKKAPDISSLLAFEQQTVNPFATTGVDRSKQKLGRPSLLGDA